MASKEFDIKNNIMVVVGLTLYPKQILELNESLDFGKDNIHFVHLLCSSEVRKNRLFFRGDSHYWQGHKDWYDEFYDEMEKADAFKIDNSNLSIEKTAEIIMNYLNKKLN